MRSRVSVRIRLTIVLAVVGVITGVLIFTAATRASSMYLTVPELRHLGGSAVGQSVSVSGTIVGKTIQWNAPSQTLSFTIRDDQSGQTLPVIYHGSRPDDFTNDWPVILTGTLQANGTFVAQQLLVKCPSKYEAANATVQ